MNSIRSSRGDSKTAVLIVVAVILLAVLIVLLFTRSPQPAPQPVPEQVPVVTQEEPEQQKIVWEETPVKKKTKKVTKKAPVKKTVTTPKKTTKTTTPAKVIEVPQPPATPASTTTQQVTHVSDDGQETRTSLEADCTRVIVVKRPRPLESVGTLGSTVTVVGSLQNCNWIPTKMPKLFARIIDSRNQIMSQQKAIYLPGSLTSAVYTFSTTIRLIDTPANDDFPGYIVFTGTDSVGNAIREVRIPIMFK